MIERPGVDWLLAVAVGAVVWALSPIVVATAEPWDADSFYYPLSLLVTGVAFGWFRPRRVWIHYLGVFAGQLAYMLLFLRWGALLVLGVGFLALCSLLTPVGAVGGIGARKLIDRIFDVGAVRK